MLPKMSLPTMATLPLILAGMMSRIINGDKPPSIPVRNPPGR